MVLSPEQVRQVASLARLALSDDEVRVLGEQLSAILEHVVQLQSLDVQGVPAMTHASVDEAARLRDDAVIPSMGAERAVAGAPERFETRVVVPRIIE